MNTAIDRNNQFAIRLLWICLTATLLEHTLAQEPATSTPFQPLRANLLRVAETLNFLGAPLDETILGSLQNANPTDDSEALAEAIESEVSFFVHINPEVRVKVRKRPGPIPLQQGGYTPVLIKVTNQSTSVEQLRILSPQSGPVYAGMTPLSAVRMQREALAETSVAESDPDRFLALEMYQKPPMQEHLSGLQTEYAIGLIYAHTAGQWEATIGFDVGQGNQDIGFRGEVATLFQVQPAIEVKLRVLDEDNQPTTGRFVFRDAQGHVYPPQAKRLAPDFYFQEQVYRSDGETVTLPPGQFSVTSSRGPEYRTQERSVIIDAANPTPELRFQLERWIRPEDYGFYSGDHHIHGAGCAHYNMPTLGVTPADMFRQVKGEGLNVGCVLTWGPCFEFQRQFFDAAVDALSESKTLMKYDLEISGFGSAALGHVCLLNLKNQTYPGSEGTKDKGWPTWTTPVLRWAREQGGITGYAHSASGLQINPTRATQRLFTEFDANRDGTLTRAEAKLALLPQSFSATDQDHDEGLAPSELRSAIDSAADTLPNFAIPEMNSVGAMEICVSVAAGVCDFISAMDTARIPEWNMFYHILNCGFPLKVSGETDFPCMSGSRVGQGRVYVRLGKQRRLDFTEWCQGLAAGRSYVSDGFAHALDFAVNQTRPGSGSVHLEQPGSVTVTAEVAFAPRTPETVAQGQITPVGGSRFVGDTVTFHGPPPTTEVEGGQRRVELVQNGRVIATQTFPANGHIRRLTFKVPVADSSWFALRHFPQLHTNPVDVLVANRPIRANARSARWCQETIRQLWRARHRQIAASERKAAEATFEWAIAQYQQIATEAAERGH